MDYKKQHFTGERALFRIRGGQIEESRFDDGESPLKESRNFQVRHSTFGWKYPLWYSKRFKVEDCVFEEMGRAGIWYSRDFELDHCEYTAPKGLRKCRRFKVRNSHFPNAQETLWWNNDFELENIQALEAPYFCMGSKNVRIKHLELQGNYAFDGCRNVTIEDSHLLTKDAFWNAKNIVLKNCYVEGEYFGWNSENVTLIDCEIHSHQGFCYMKNIKLVNCKIIDTDLAFEYCQNIDAEITTPVDSIKNPISGRIVVPAVGELIRDDERLDQKATEIIYQ
ncbi:MAG: DUF3737 family protein [Bacilli bacterium]|nr:DUF3737 family protein [Bacilli bacterium]